MILISQTKMHKQINKIIHLFCYSQQRTNTNQILPFIGTYKNKELYFCYVLLCKRDLMAFRYC